MFLGLLFNVHFPLFWGYEATSSSCFLFCVCCGVCSGVCLGSLEFFSRSIVFFGVYEGASTSFLHFSPFI